MNDLLDQLRAANPVDRDALQVSPSMAARVLDRPAPAPRRRRRRRLIVLGVGTTAAAAMVLLAASLPRSAAPDLAARAYAAVTGPGIAHWRTELLSPGSDGRRHISEVQEGWSAGGVQHVLSYRRPNGHERLETDTVIAHDKMTQYYVVSRALHTSRAPTVAASDGVVFGDPMRAFRLAKRAGVLVRTGPNSYRVDPTRIAGSSRVVGGQPLTYVLDPRTALPRALIIRWGAYTALGGFHHPAGTAVTRFTTYEQLPDTTANRAKLRMLPHPAVSTAGPARYYALLRHGRRLTSAEKQVVDHVGDGQLGLDPRRARAGRAGVVVIPGRGALCVQIGGAGSCGTLHTALREGMGIGGSDIDGQWVLVPDGVRSVLARLPRHPWQRFRVIDNLVQLPNGGYHARFALPPAIARTAP
jgi:hypothetical protein